MLNKYTHKQQHLRGKCLVEYYSDLTPTPWKKKNSKKKLVKLSSIFKAHTAKVNYELHTHLDTITSYTRFILGQLYTYEINELKAA